MEFLTRAGDHAGFDEVDHAIGEHLRMDAKVAMPGQRLQYRVGHGADAHLQGRAVIDQGRDMFRDRVMDIA